MSNPRADFLNRLSKMLGPCEFCTKTGSASDPISLYDNPQDNASSLAMHEACNELHRLTCKALARERIVVPRDINKESLQDMEAFLSSSERISQATAALAMGDVEGAKQLLRLASLCSSCGRTVGPEGHCEYCTGLNGTDMGSESIGSYWRQETPSRYSSLHTADEQGKVGDMDEKPLEEQTPAEIDAKLFPLKAKYDHARQAMANYQTYLQKPGLMEYERKSHQKSVDEYSRQADEIGEQIRPLSDEFDRRGGWSRHFIVTNHDGHYHNTEGCQSLYPGKTMIAWDPEYSGLDEDDVVNKAGYSACTFCFPTAPANKAWAIGKEKYEAELQAKRDAQCPGSGSSPENYEYGRRYITCPECKGTQSVTPNGKIRTHKPWVDPTCPGSGQEYDPEIQKKGFGEYDDPKCHECGRRIWCHNTGTGPNGLRILDRHDRPKEKK